MADTAGFYRDRAPATVTTFDNTVMSLSWDRYSVLAVNLRGTSTIGTISTVRTKYILRGWDSGSGGRWVTWTSFETPNSNPQAVETIPTYTGSLSAIRVEKVL